MVTESRKDRLNNEEPIKGWLAFFLWVVVAGGTIVSICRSIYLLTVKISETFISLVYIHKVVGYIVSVCFVVRLIRSYYKVRDNAIPLTYTYLIFIQISVLAGLLYWSLTGYFMRPPLNLFLSFLLGLLLFCYVKKSKQIQRRFEEICGHLFIFDKVLIVVCMLNLVGNYLFTEAWRRDSIGMLNSRYYVEDVVKYMNNESRSDKGTDLLCKKVVLEEDTIVSYYKFTQIEADKIKKQSNAIAVKMSLLREIALYGYSNPEKVKGMDRIVEYGYYQNYRYLDKYEHFVFQCNISPEEYKQARMLGVFFRCDSLSWKKALEQETLLLPYSILDYCQLLQVSVDYRDRRLNLVVQLPAEGAMSTMDQYSLTQYINNSSYALSENPLIQMAQIDKMILSFRFIKTDGEDYTTIDVPCDSFEYQAQYRP